MTETSRPSLHVAATEAAVGAGEGQVERVREGLADADRRLRQFVQVQPLTALLGAVVAGYITARVFRRL
jgi:hypothetical protein